MKFDFFDDVWHNGKSKWRKHDRKGAYAMYILDTVKVDGSGRVSVSGLFDEFPEEVVPVFDADSKKVLFLDAVDDWLPSARRKIDSKNRVSLPKWFAEELGTEFYVYGESAEEHSLLPKKFFPIL